MRWEYKTVHLLKGYSVTEEITDKFLSELQEKLDLQGKQGWELVSYGALSIFKRPAELP